MPDKDNKKAVRSAMKADRLRKRSRKKAEKAEEAEAKGKPVRAARLKGRAGVLKARAAGGPDEEGEETPKGERKHRREKRRREKSGKDGLLVVSITKDPTNKPRKKLA